MEIEHMWALAEALGLAAFTTALKAVEYRHELKLTNDELSRLRKKFDTLQQQHDQSVTDSQNFNSAEKEKLVNRISDLEKQASLSDSKRHRRAALSYDPLDINGRHNPSP